jgi:hypothetical protein
MEGGERLCEERLCERGIRELANAQNESWPLSSPPPLSLLAVWCCAEGERETYGMSVLVCMNTVCTECTKH